MTRPWPAYVDPSSGAELDLEDDSRVVRGIPRFVTSDDYTASFGAQWTRYPTAQLDSRNGTTISRDRLRRCLGESLWARLPASLVLEVGCGAGRFTEVLLAEGARVLSVDMSSAVETNAELFGVTDRHRVVQADLHRLQLRERQFDVVLCLGVVQHTPSPERAIAALLRHVRPGERLVFDHYTHSLSYYTKASTYLVRPWLRRLPPELGLQVTEQLVRFLYPVHRAVRRRRMAQVVLSRVSPVRTYFQAFPQLSDADQRALALVDTHDALTDHYKHFRTRGQLRRTLSQLGATVERCEYAGNGVEVRARAP